jgi:hypothetical protein
MALYDCAIALPKAGAQLFLFYRQMMEILLLQRRLNFVVFQAQLMRTDQSQPSEPIEALAVQKLQVAAREGPRLRDPAAAGE